MSTTSRRCPQLVMCVVVPLIGDIALAQTNDTVHYIKARDRAIEEFKAPFEELGTQYQSLMKTQNMGAANAYWTAHSGPLFSKERERLDLLERLLRKVVGPFAAEGFNANSTMNLETLVQEGDFGRLDGFVYKSLDDRTQILVTTRALANDWLRKFYQRPTHDVLDLVRALSVQAEPFMTQAWAIEDQHFTLVSRLPVTEPKGTQRAVAFLGELSADDANYVPNMILAALVRGDRLYLVSQSLSVKPPILSDCDRQWQTLWDQGKYHDAASAFKHCYTSGLPSTPSYGATVVQAQRLVDSLSR